MVQWCYYNEVLFMAYFLKKSKQQNRVYLSIYESFYSPETKGTKHKCFKSLGHVDKLIESGIDDPISFYQKEVERMNAERKESKKEEPSVPQISDVSPEKLLGYFPLANILNDLDVEQHFNHMQSGRRFQFSVFDIFSSLVFARVVAPLSKHKTFHDVLPCLYKEVDFSYDQLLDCVEFVGSEYEKFVEIFTAAVKENYGIDTKNTFFDCTNFFFEIDRENEFQARGPSKENRHDPIVGMGLLLDGQMLPIGMRMYPGNQSEKPVIRNTISSLKRQNNIQGRTVQVADKGLNCAQNIIEAVNNNDGYLFSKSVKQLPEKEQKWVLLENDYTEVMDKNGKIKYKYKSCIDQFEYKYKDEDGRVFKKKVTEKRVVTYSPKLAKKKNLEIDKMVNRAKKAQMYQAKKSEFGDTGKYLNISSEDGEKAIVSLNEEAIEKDRKMAGYNMLITSEIQMEEIEIYNVYHNLWRIEESFRIMKSDLDARPVYLQKENSIKGHFLICYVAVLLERILQFKKLNSVYSSSQIYDFFRDFRVLKISDNRYINLSKSTEFIKGLSELLNHPLTNYYLTEKQIKKMHTR